MNTLDWEERRVYDIALRFLHWWNALSIAALLLTGWSRELFEHGPNEALLQDLHVFLGYGLLAGLAARLLWGVVGPPHARWSDLWHPRVWIDTLRLQPGPLGQRFGHHELASLAFLVVYGLLAVMLATGFPLALLGGHGEVGGMTRGTRWLLKLGKDLHEGASTVLATFIFVHVALLLLHQRRDGDSTAQSMLTGIQRRRRSGTT